MLKKADKNANRLQRHKRVRRKITGTTQRPRLCVFRSSNNIYAQIIDDANRVTLTAASSLDAEVKGAVNHGGNKEARSEEHTSVLQSRFDLVCRLLLEKKKKKQNMTPGEK